MFIWIFTLSLLVCRVGSGQVTIHCSHFFFCNLFTLLQGWCHDVTPALNLNIRQFIEIVDWIWFCPCLYLSNHGGIDNNFYYSFKIFPRFWLFKTTRITHHNQLMLTKNFVILNRWHQKCSPLQIIEPLMSKITNWTTDRENLGTRLCYLTKREMASSRFTSLSEENNLNE